MANDRLAFQIFACSAALYAAACTGAPPGGGDDDGVDPDPDGGSSADPDTGVSPVSCEIDIPLGAVRPVDIMSLAELGQVVARVPCLPDGPLKDLLESPDTLWYDRLSIIPGYQDSYGDNINFPVGMRPNTISPSLIAVPNGHTFVFEEIGTFHFPFGRPGGFGDDGEVVNFWHVPRDAGVLRPVVWWRRQPTSWHRRIEWMFPKDTVFGELLFKVTADGRRFPFEIRTRTRRVDGWTFDAYRPFPTAESLAAALERKRQEQPAWATAPDITALIAHLRNAGTLRAGQLAGPQFAISFPTLSGHEDVLPGLSDPTILEELMLETPFVSARGAVWKQGSAGRAYAATTDAAFSIVPRDYNAGFIEVSDASCERCHRDAGRPFKDYYPSIMLYGELWGEDETFSWHPFDNSSFVDADGDVVGFGPPDNRRFRADFQARGLLVPYDQAMHVDAVYRKIPRAWRNYVYD